jgi:glycosyltransferase involved in cell wall biosynthesis
MVPYFVLLQSQLLWNAIKNIKHLKSNNCYSIAANCKKISNIMSAKISIIVPVYKAEKYLRKCIDSIVNQTHSFFELILVDDGSPDNSGKICDNYAKNDSRIKVIHIENSGVSIARNEGLKLASGEYVVFVDSDDYVKSDLVSNIINEVNINNSDIIFFGVCYEQYHKGGYIQNSIVLPGILYSNVSTETIEILFEMFRIGLAHASPGKVYKTSILQIYNIRFIERQQYGEDTCFFLDYCVRVKSVSSINKIQYHKVKYPDESLSSGYSDNQYLYLLRIRQRLHNIINVRGQSFNCWNAINPAIFYHFCCCVDNLKSPHCGLPTIEKITNIAQMITELDIKNLSKKINPINKLSQIRYFAIRSGNPFVIYAAFCCFKR